MPADFKRVLFNEGLKFLMQTTGKAEPNLRGLIGKWCKDHGDEKTAGAIMAAQKASAVDLIAYITKILKGDSHAKRDDRDPARTGAILFEGPRVRVIRAALTTYPDEVPPRHSSSPVPPGYSSSGGADPSSPRKP